MRLTIHISKNPVSIDIDCYPANKQDPNCFMYSNLKNMYKSGNGHCLQCNENHDPKKLEEVCAKISDLLYKYIEEDYKGC